MEPMDLPAAQLREDFLPVTGQFGVRDGLQKTRYGTAAQAGTGASRRASRPGCFPRKLKLRSVTPCPIWSPQEVDNLKDRTQVGGEQIFFFFRMGLQDVETDGELDIGRIHQNYVVNPFGADDGQNLVNQITVRIKNSDAFAVLNILPDQIQQQGRFAGAR